MVPVPLCHSCFCNSYASASMLLKWRLYTLIHESAESPTVTVKFSSLGENCYKKRQKRYVYSINYMLVVIQGYVNSIFVVCCF